MLAGMTGTISKAVGVAARAAAMRIKFERVFRTSVSM
jgi:hypothetical protein